MGFILGFGAVDLFIAFLTDLLYASPIHRDTLSGYCQRRKASRFLMLHVQTRSGQALLKEDALFFHQLHVFLAGATWRFMGS